MVSENVFHQRGTTLLYRTSNLIIQSVLYGKFRIIISIYYSSLYVLRDLCIAFLNFNIYNNVSYLILLLLDKSQQFDRSDQCKARRACTREARKSCSAL